MSEIVLSYDGLSSEEIYEQAEVADGLAHDLNVRADELARQFRSATDMSERDRVWDAYVSACRDVTVMNAWYNILYSAYILSLHGGMFHTPMLQDITIEQRSTL